MCSLAQRLWLLGFFLLQKQLIRSIPRPQKLLLVTLRHALLDLSNSLPSTTHRGSTKEVRRAVLKVWARSETDTGLPDFRLILRTHRGLPLQSEILYTL
jgi:hypothetical protein